MNWQAAITQEMFAVKVCVGVVVFGFLLWLVLHEMAFRRVRRKQADHHLRIVKMESYPSHEDRLKAVEAEVDLLHRAIDALRSNSFTGETLRRVK